MGIFSSIFGNNVSGYDDPYDYRIDAILKIVDNLLDGDIGDLRKIKSGNDWGFAGGTIHGLMGTNVLNDNYYEEIESYYHNGISLDKCVDRMCDKFDKLDFKRQCDLYANRPLF